MNLTAHEVFDLELDPTHHSAHQLHPPPQRKGGRLPRTSAQHHRRGVQPHQDRQSKTATAPKSRSASWSTTRWSSATPPKHSRSPSTAPITKHCASIRHWLACASRSFPSKPSTTASPGKNDAAAKAKPQPSFLSWIPYATSPATAHQLKATKPHV